MEIPSTHAGALDRAAQSSWATKSRKGSIIATMEVEGAARSGCACCTKPEQSAQAWPRFLK